MNAAKVERAGVESGSVRPSGGPPADRATRTYRIYTRSIPSQAIFRPISDAAGRDSRRTVVKSGHHEADAFTDA